MNTETSIMVVSIYGHIKSHELNKQRFKMSKRGGL